MTIATVGGVQVAQVTSAPSGISWALRNGTFSSTGHYVNGEAWVVAAAGGVEVVSVTPAPAGTGSTTRNGSMRNVLGPTHLAIGANKAGYDGRAASFDQGLTVTFATSLTLAPGESLVSTESSLLVGAACSPERQFHGRLSCSSSLVKKAAVLTVLAVQPPTDAFRPAYAGTPPVAGSTTTSRTRVGLDLGATSGGHYTASMIDYSQLHKLQVPSSLQPYELPNLYDNSFAGQPGLYSYFRRVWLDHLGTEWNEDEINPTDHMPGYGLTLVAAVSLASLALLENDTVGIAPRPDRTNATREPLLWAFLQAGIDSYGVVRGDQTYAQNPTAAARQPFPGSGGKGGGRLWPILFTGKVLGDQGMQHPPRALANGDKAFKEDYQYFNDGVPDWQGSNYKWRINSSAAGHLSFSPCSYTLGVPSRASLLEMEPGTYTPSSRPAWQQWTALEVRSEEYRFSTSASIVGTALAIRAMDAFDLVGGGDALLGYVDRYMVPMHDAAMREYDVVYQEDPDGLFASHYHYSTGEQSQGRTVGLTSYQDEYYHSAMWHSQRWLKNREHMAVLPSNFSSGLPVQGGPTLRQPVLVCHQGLFGDPVTNLKFEVYDLPVVVVPPVGGVGSTQGIAYLAVYAVFLGGIADFGGHLLSQQMSQLTFCSGNDATIFVNSGLSVAFGANVSTKYGYASFTLPFPAAFMGIDWTIQVVAQSPLTCSTGDHYMVASNAWWFK